MARCWTEAPGNAPPPWSARRIRLAHKQPRGRTLVNLCNVDLLTAAIRCSMKPELSSEVVYDAVPMFMETV